MSLAKGLYVIESRLTGGTVGRNIREDRSFRPKPIVVHPTSGGLLYQATWLIEPKEDDSESGTYRLLNLGGLAVGKDKALYADIVDPSADVFWKIEALSQEGITVYTITLPDARGEGWRVDDSKEWSQLAVGPLIVQPSFPPLYHASGIYTITRLDRFEEKA